LTNTERDSFDFTCRSMLEQPTAPEPTKPRFQFTVVQTFAAMAACSLFFGLVAWGGWMGGFLFGVFCGVILLGVAISIRNARYLGFALLLIAISGFSATASTGVFDVALGVGQATLPVTLRIIDETGNPINSANVGIREVGLASLPANISLASSTMPEAYRPGVYTTSDSSGKATLTYTFSVLSRMGRFVDECNVYIRPDLWIQVDAPGYERRSFRLETVLGRSYDRDKTPFPIIKVKLEPVAS